MYQHQLDGVEFLVKMPAAGLWYEQGLGKTRTMIEAMDRIGGTPWLIVCPATVVGVWEREFARWKPGWRCTRLYGTGMSRDKRCAKADIAFRTLTIPTACIINYEGLRIFNETHVVTDPTTGARHRVVRNSMAERAWAGAVCDESSRIKTHNRVQSRACHALAHVPRRYCLSGTPITRNMLDLWSQYRFMAPGVLGRSYWVFEQRYGVREKIWVKGGKQRAVVVGVRHEDELLRRVEPHCLRRKKTECTDLPPKIEQEEIVELGADAKKAYKQLAEDMITRTENGSVATAADILTRLTRLQQVTQGYLPMDDGTVVRFDPNAKRDALADMLDRMRGTGQFIVWHRFREDLRNIVSACEDAGIAGDSIAVVNGAVPMEQRGRTIDAFQRGQYEVIVCQYQCASYGITLTAGTYSIKYAPTFDLELDIQSSDRIHRIGQNKTTYEIMLIAENTIDRYIQQALRTKQQMVKRFDAHMLRKIVQGLMP